MHFAGVVYTINTPWNRLPCSFLVMLYGLMLSSTSVCTVVRMYTYTKTLASTREDTNGTQEEVQLEMGEEKHDRAPQDV